MEQEMLPAYIASALVAAHGAAAATVAAEEAKGCLERGELANMRLWQAAGTLADLVVSCQRSGSAGGPSRR
jgi:hypothetical protein